MSSHSIEFEKGAFDSALGMWDPLQSIALDAFSLFDWPFTVTILRFFSVNNSDNLSVVSMFVVVYLGYNSTPDQACYCE